MSEIETFTAEDVARQIDHLLAEMRVSREEATAAWEERCCRSHAFEDLTINRRAAESLSWLWDIAAVLESDEQG